MDPGVGEDAGELAACAQVAVGTIHKNVAIARREIHICETRFIASIVAERPKLEKRITAQCDIRYCYSRAGPRLDSVSFFAALAWSPKCTCNLRLSCSWLQTDINIESIIVEQERLLLGNQRAEPHGENGTVFQVTIQHDS